MWLNVFFCYVWVNVFLHKILLFPRTRRTVDDDLPLMWFAVYDYVCNVLELTNRQLIRPLSKHFMFLFCTWLFLVVDVAVGDGYFFVNSTNCFLEMENMTLKLKANKYFYIHIFQKNHTKQFLSLLAVDRSWKANQWWSKKWRFIRIYNLVTNLIYYDLITIRYLSDFFLIVFL